MPIALTPEHKALHDEHYLSVYGRLKAGVPREQAEQELAGFAADLRKRFPKDDAELSFAITPFRRSSSATTGRVCSCCSAAVGFVLLIACGNVANLLLARGAARAGRWRFAPRSAPVAARIVRQLLTESVVLALICRRRGARARGAGASARSSPPRRTACRASSRPRSTRSSLGFTLLIALASTVLFGLAPAVRLARSDVQTVLKEGGRGAAIGGVRDRLRTGLIVGEVARRPRCCSSARAC